MNLNLSFHVRHPVVGELDPVEGDGCLCVPELPRGRAGVMGESVGLVKWWVTTASYHPLGTEKILGKLSIFYKSKNSLVIEGV
jgi:hypothetical protein